MPILFLSHHHCLHFNVAATPLCRHLKVILRILHSVCTTPDTGLRRESFSRRPLYDPLIRQSETCHGLDTMAPRRPAFGTEQRVLSTTKPTASSAVSSTAYPTANSTTNPAEENEPATRLL